LYEQKTQVKIDVFKQYTMAKPSLSPAPARIKATRIAMKATATIAAVD
jgi:hypothetical protein